VCLVCGTDWSGLGGECVLCVGEFSVGFWRVRVCCMWESLVWVWRSECVLCVEEFVVGFGD